jgi:hypothetical protein
MKMLQSFLALALAATGYLLLSSSAFSQGNLTPPGPPGRTMKALDQIEPRTPIESVPFIIDQSGSYYLTKNLNFTAASGHAITISASNVTVDLMGFTLSSSSAVTGDGIHINGGVRNIAVRNGTITGNTVVTITGSAPSQNWSVAPAGFSIGINGSIPPTPTGRNFNDLRISGCRTIGLEAGDESIIENVIATQNGNTGIDAGNGSAVAHSSAASNGSTGVSAATVTNCTARSNASHGIFALTVANCTALNNGTNGIIVFTGSVSNSFAISNGTNGISSLNNVSITNCAASSNKDTGIVADTGSVTNSNAYHNGSDGIYAPGGVVAFCTASGNNISNNGSVNIDATGATRTGNNPTP